MSDTDVSNCPVDVPSLDAIDQEWIEDCLSDDEIELPKEVPPHIHTTHHTHISPLTPLPPFQLPVCVYVCVYAGLHGQCDVYVGDSGG
jgi:hypothetical protein